MNTVRRHRSCDRRGFTVIELLIVVTVLAILLTLSILIFAGLRWKSTDMIVLHSAADAQKVLQAFGAVNDTEYPSNIAGTGYAPPLMVAMALYTDAVQIPVYANLTSDQNAQLFLNACNAFMPVTSGGTTYNEACVFAGQNIHIKGTVSSNVVVQGPTINQGDFRLNCGAVCTAAETSIVNAFVAQGGTFPISVPNRGGVLPAPVLRNTGMARAYCLEVRTPTFSDIIYHATQNSGNPVAGPCPSNPSLHYP